MNKIPEFLYSLFWDYDIDSIDIKVHAFLIMSRVMERGTWEAMNWLRRTYSNEDLREFIENKGVRLLPPRELNYWAFICGIPDKQRQNIVDDAAKIHAKWQGFNRVP